MAIDFSKICITHEPLAIPAPEYHITVGAILDFQGVVRGSENDGAIAGLDYEVFQEMAENKLRAIATDIAAEFALQHVTLLHRVGFVPAGEPSLFLRVGAAHRNEAYAGSREIIERLKREVPIWKHPVQMP